MKGRTHDNVSVPAAGGMVNVDLHVTEANWINFYILLFGTTAPSDLKFEVRAYDDRDKLFDLPLIQWSLNGGVVVGADVLAEAAYHLYGADRIQVRVRNEHATLAKNATVIYHGAPA